MVRSVADRTFQLRSAVDWKQIAWKLQRSPAACEFRYTRQLGGSEGKRPRKPKKSAAAERPRKRAAKPAGADAAKVAAQPIAPPKEAEPLSDDAPIEVTSGGNRAKPAASPKGKAAAPPAALRARKKTPPPVKSSAPRTQEAAADAPIAAETRKRRREEAAGQRAPTASKLPKKAAAK